MTTTLQPTEVSTREFAKCGAHLYVAEDSSLPRPSRVYADACDVGYTLINSKGNRVVVAEAGREYDGEGDLLHVDYEPVLKCYRFTIRVLND